MEVYADGRAFILKIVGRQVRINFRWCSFLEARNSVAPSSAPSQLVALDSPVSTPNDLTEVDRTQHCGS